MQQQQPPHRGEEKSTVNELNLSVFVDKFLGKNTAAAARPVTHSHRELSARGAATSVRPARVSAPTHAHKARLKIS